MSYANGGDTKARAHSPSEGNVVDHHAAGGELMDDTYQKLQVHFLFCESHRGGPSWTT